MDVQFDISNIYFGLQTLKDLEESFVSLSSAMNGITINSSLLSSDSLFETSKREINNATNSTIHNLVTLLDNSKKILEQYDREAALLFQYYEQGILTEDGKWTAVPLMNQDDYGDIIYSQGSVKTSGCGLTSLCMVASYILGDLFTPEDLAAIANADKSSNVGRMTTAADYVGLDWVKDPNTSREDLVNYLNEGKMVICLVKGSSHFVLCTGVNENGQIEVNDPYSPFRQESHKDGYDWNELQFSAGSTWVFDPAQNTGSNVVNDKVTVDQEVLDRLAEQGIDLNAMNQVVPENTEVKPDTQPEQPVEEPNNQTTTLSAPEQQQEPAQTSNKPEPDNTGLTKEQLLEKTKEQARLRNQAIKEKLYHSDQKTTPSTYDKPSTNDTNVSSSTPDTSSGAGSNQPVKQETTSAPQQSAPKPEAPSAPQQSAPKQEAPSAPQQSAPKQEAPSAPQQSAPKQEAPTAPQQSAPKQEAPSAPQQSAPKQEAPTAPQQSAPKQEAPSVPQQSAPKQEVPSAPVRQETPSTQTQPGETTIETPTTPSTPETPVPDTNSGVVDTQPPQPSIESNIQTGAVETPDITPPTNNDVITEPPVVEKPTNDMMIETDISNNTTYPSTDITQPEQPITETPSVQETPQVQETPTIENNIPAPKQEQPIIEEPTKEQAIIASSNNTMNNTPSSSSGTNINHSSSTTTKTESIDIPVDTTGTIGNSEEFITENETLDYEMTNDTQYTDYSINSTIGSSTLADRTDSQLYPTQMEDSVIPYIEEPQVPHSTNSIKKEENNTAWVPGAIGIATVAAAGIATVGAVKKSKKNNE